MHPLERARLLSGLVISTATRTVLLRTGEYKPADGNREALQAGPFLVDGRKPVAGLNGTARAARTAVFSEALGVAGMLVADAVTLAELGAILATLEILPGRKIERALNLDGGTSSGLWVRQQGEAFYCREWKQVRNYLVVVPRGAAKS